VIAAATTIVRRLILSIQKDTSEPHLCLVGEVFQVPAIAEASARAFPTGTISVHSLGGHATAAVGAALLGWELVSGVPARPATGLARARGPGFSDDEIHAFLDTYGFPYRDGVEGAGLARDMEADGLLVEVFEDQLSLMKQATNAGGGPAPLTPFDAYGHLMESDRDALMMGDCLILKREQPAWLARRRAPRPSRAETAIAQDRRIQRWVHRLPATTENHAVPSGWVAPRSDAPVACVEVDRSTTADEIPAQLVSRLPAGKVRTAVRRLIASALSAGA
jgi:hypothetical protein